MAKTKIRAKCPPGVLCMSSNIGYVIVTILAVAVLFIGYAVFFLRPVHPPPTIIIPNESTQRSQQTTIIPVKGGDSRYDIAPQPLRDWISMPEFPPRGGLSTIPINIPTQGLPESFQSIGIVNIDDKILPLYGRRTTGGRSDRWNYYTRTDTYNPVPVPIHYEKRDCMDDVGCKEILSGDEVKIDALNKSGKTNIYNYGGPRYIPGIL